MTERERLIELICTGIKKHHSNDRQYLHDSIANVLLENDVIVPPCKVGDTVYKLCTVNSRIKFGDMWDGTIVKNNCDRCGYRGCSCYNIGIRRHECDTMIDIVTPIKINNIEFLIKIMPYFSTIYFITKEEAEKALKETESVTP